MDSYKHHIFALVGRSGSGKSTLQKMAQGRLILPMGMTTRKPREGEVGGVDYLFLSVHDIIDLAVKDKLVLLNNVYNTVFYAYRKADFYLGNCIVIVDLVGLRQLQEVFGHDNVTGVYIECPEDVIRARNTSFSSARVYERKLIDDNKFKHVYNLCDYKVTNDGNIDESIESLKSIIREVLYEKQYL